MNRCINCNNVFEDWEMTERTETLCWIDQSPYQETYECCPYCGKSEIEHDVEECKSCGEYFKPDELYSGFCIDCLKAKVTASNGKQFLIDVEHLIKFMACEIFNVAIHGAVGGEGTDHLCFAFEDYYDRLVEENGEDWMVDKLVDWIFDDESWGGEMFSGWLKRKEV